MKTNKTAVTSLLKDVFEVDWTQVPSKPGIKVIHKKNGDVTLRIEDADHFIYIQEKANIVVLAKKHGLQRCIYQAGENIELDEADIPLINYALSSILLDDEELTLRRYIEKAESRVKTVQNHVLLSKLYARLAQLQSLGNTLDK